VGEIMPVIEYKCLECDKIVEIDKPFAEQYNPECCKHEMVRVWSAPTIIAGALNKKNLPK
jgi:predicted nucleic acid-binding Zn ribbon protein